MFRLTRCASRKMLAELLQIFRNNFAPCNKLISSDGDVLAVLGTFSILIYVKKIRVLKKKEGNCKKNMLPAIKLFNIFTTKS